jgi:hypothetical protein
MEGRRPIAVLRRVEGRRGGQPRRPPWGLAALGATASWNYRRSRADS